MSPADPASPAEAKGPQEPHVGSFQLKRSLAFAWLLYALLALAAAVSLLGSARAELVPPAVRAVAPFAFGLFLASFAIYRFALVRAGRYPAFRALYQVGAGLLFILLLLPGTARQFGGARPRTLVDLLADPDPVVRALAAEVAPLRPASRALALALVARLDDPAEEVRARAEDSLRKLAGEDLGRGEGPAEARRRWEAWAGALPSP
jgi:hypothetical protein